jgi:hypothetical protein
MSKKCKGDRKRRPRMQTQVNGKPIEALVDSGALVSVMSKKAFKTVWEHWNMQRLPIPAALTVSGVNGEKIDVTGYVEIPLNIKDEKTDEVRLFTSPVLVLLGIGQIALILGYDFIQEEGMIIDGAANETYFADRRADGGDTWWLASLCCLRRTTILPKTITHAVVGTVTQGGDRVQAITRQIPVPMSLMHVLMYVLIYVHDLYSPVPVQSQYSPLAEWNRLSLHLQWTKLSL